MFDYYSKKEKKEIKSLVKKVIKGFCAFVAFLILLDCFFVIQSGELGLITEWGRITDNTKTAGLNFKVPVVNGVRKVDITTQKIEDMTEASSKDLQIINALVALNYRINPDYAVSLYTNVGQDFQQRVITPNINESIKGVMAQYNAEEIITKRSEVSAGIKALLSERLAPYGLVVEAVNIANLELSPAFDEAVEAKVTAEQNALAEKNKLESIKYQAEQQVVAAKGKSEAMRIEGEALRANPELLQLKMVERWNGVMPTTMGGEVSLNRIIQ